MKNYMRLFAFVLMFCSALSIKVNAQNYNIPYISEAASSSLLDDYGTPSNYDYTATWGGGPYLLENDPNGLYLGQFDNTYAVGGDCYRLLINFWFMMAPYDEVLLYEVNPATSALEVTGYIYNYRMYSSETPVIYSAHFVSKYQSPGHFVYVRVIKRSGDTVNDYYIHGEDNVSCYYGFRGVYWSSESI